MLAISSYMRVAVAALLAGIAIKLMDDCIDSAYDSALGLPNIINRFGTGFVAYGMVSLLAACIINVTVTVALFTAAYAVGMGFSGDAKYPTGLTARTETLLALLLSSLVAGLCLTAMALCVMIGVQLIDNWIDQEKGLLYPIMAIGSFSLSILISGEALLVLFAYALFFALERWCKHCLQ